MNTWLKIIFIGVLLNLSCLQGQAQTYTSWISGNSADVATTHQEGVLLAGGGTDNDDAMRWFLQKAQGGDVVVIRASGSNGYNSYLYSELGVTVHSVETLLIPSKSAAQESYVAQQIRNAEALFIAGGDQYQYYQYWKDTPVEDAINYLLQTKKVVVGGTSAGMMILGKAYYAPENDGITTNEALPNPYHANMKLLGKNDFLNAPYLKNTLNDTHYDQRSRAGRHTAFLARMETDWEMNSRGIACNEHTAVAIESTGKARVFGSNSDDYAYFLQSNGEYPNSAPEVCQSGQSLRWQKAGKAVKVYKILGTTNGANSFELSDWRTGSGGSWENWTVQNNAITKSATTELPALPTGELQLKQETQNILHNGSFQMGYAVIGQTPLTKTFTVWNSGEGTLSIEPPTLNNTKLTLSNSYIAQILPTEGSVTFQLTYTATTEETSQTTLNIVSNDTDENPFKTTITALGLVTAVEEANWWKGRIQISPNPAQNEVKIVFSNTNGKNIDVKLQDAQGKSWYETQTKQNIILPTQTLPIGVYLLYVQAGKHKSIYKIVKN